MMLSYTHRRLIAPDLTLIVAARPEPPPAASASTHPDVLKETGMSTAKTSRISRIASRARAIWAELDNAQARLLEIRTGVPGLTQRRQPRRAGRVRRSSFHTRAG